MPTQKDLKRLVRSRMKKTGEAYTAARLQLLKNEPTPPTLADRNFVSDWFRSAAMPAGGGRVSHTE